MFQQKTGNEKVIYFHCSSHELNLALSKASKVPDVYNIVCLLQSLGIYFVKSPKRQGHFETDVNSRFQEKEFNTMKKKIKPLCETRWVERHSAFEDLEGLYKFIVPFLEKVSANEDRIWDPKSVTEDSGLLRQILCGISSVQTPVWLHQGLVIATASTNMEIARAYEVTVIKDEFQSIQENAEDEFKPLFRRATDMAAEVGKCPLDMSRTAGRQTLRSNVTANTPEQYWRKTIFVPFIDCLNNQLEDRF